MVGLGTAPAADALDNGLALTPQMGFDNWNATQCTSTFNEAMIESIADLFVSSGLKAAGYEYVNLDDCWALPARDANGNLVPDPVRFPDGIKAVADYVHSKGLKFGLYSSAGTKTCNGQSGFPGSLGYEQQDAEQWASWGVDYLKYDNCNNDGTSAEQRYTTMRDALLATGRPILYSICEWGESQPWTWAGSVGNSWRTTLDVTDNYSSVLSIYQANIQLGQYAGPGQWNDPDMLEIGNGGMTDIEYRSQFSLWSMMAAPLIIGSDIRTATPATMAILSDSDVIAVDQDPLGVQGTQISSVNGLDVITKPLANGDRAVALFNEGDAAATISTTASAVGLPKAAGYSIKDLWAGTSTESAGRISAVVPPHGTAMFTVHAGGSWQTLPPAVHTGIDYPALYAGAPPLVEAGVTTTVTTVTGNDGALPASAGNVSLTGPAGWTVQAESPTGFPALPGGRQQSTPWSVTVPAGTPTGSYTLHASTSYQPGSTTVGYDLTVYVVAGQPAGVSSLGDDQWISSVNGSGPMERNTSNGAAAAGDGKTITLNGQTYAKGLGTYAPSAVRYYLGGGCSTLTATVGLDDERNSSSSGSVAFQVWADGKLVTQTGVIKRGDPPQQLSADVTGASLLELVVTDGGDSNISDSADWAGAQVTCA